MKKGCHHSLDGNELHHLHTASFKPRHLLLEGLNWQQERSVSRPDRRHRLVSDGCDPVPRVAVQDGVVK